MQCLASEIRNPGFSSGALIDPYSYIRAVRLATARRLGETGIPLKEIAFRLGFASQSSFTGAFRNEMALLLRSIVVIASEHILSITRFDIGFLCGNTPNSYAIMVL